VRLPLNLKSARLRLRSRASLIAATVLLQAAVIGVGWLATMHVARQDVSARARDRLNDEVSRLVETVSADLSRSVGAPVEYRAENWGKAQTLVETCKTPSGAVLFLLDQHGRVVCHPLLRNAPNLRNLDYSEQIITIEDANDPGGVVALGGIKPGAILTGQTDLLSGPASIAVTFNQATRTKVVAYRPMAEMAAVESRLTSGLMVWGGVAGLCVLLMTVVGSIILVRRYDSIFVRANRQLEEEVESRTRRGLSIRNGLIFGLAKLADYRDTDTGRHLERICSYCELLANELLQAGTHPEIDKAWVERLKLASSMHDIGKVGIPDSILLKPGPLTPEERRLMEQHPLIGADTLVAIRQRVGDDDLLNMGIQVTLSHHERFDGKGYPYKINAEQIPLSARIVALADMYDALTSDRVYKKAMSHEQATAIIRENRGSHFDPAIVDAYLRLERRFDQTHLALKPDAGHRPALVEFVEQARRAAA
jgi:HD-GYP domain-containing protein (c-di-GMP phosphodiesterase class II)